MTQTGAVGGCSVPGMDQREDAEGTVQPRCYGCPPQQCSRQRCVLPRQQLDAVTAQCSLLLPCCLLPYRFDIRRSPNPHVAFGYGTHVCPGEYLSYKEMEAALEGKQSIHCCCTAGGTVLLFQHESLDAAACCTTEYAGESGDQMRLADHSHSRSHTNIPLLLVCDFIPPGLFTQLPDLKVAVPMSQLEYTPPDRDIGLLKLPVTWKSGKDEGKIISDKNYHGMK